MEETDFFAKVFPWTCDASARDHQDLAVLDDRALRARTLRTPVRHVAISDGSSTRSQEDRQVPRQRHHSFEYLEKYSTDAVRYWAGSARLGADTVFSEEQMKVGRRLASRS